MIELPIVVYGNGDIFQKCLAEIANIFGDDIFQTIFRMAVLLGGITAIFSAITKRDFMQCLRWFGRYYLVYCILFFPRLNVYVDDLITAKKFDSIRLPLGLAVFASYATTIGNALTHLVESRLGFGNNFVGLNYSQGGMMLASRMMIDSAQFKVSDLQFSGNLQSFIKNCSKATADNFMSSADLWATIIAGGVKSGTFTYNGAVVSCAEAVSGEGGKLFSNLSAVIEQAKIRYGKFLFPDALAPEHMLSNNLFLSFDYLLNMGFSPEQKDILAQGIMQQVMLANFIQNEIAQTVIAVPAPSFGYQVAAWLPLIKNVGEIIIYACFMFMVLLTLFPYGTTILKNYILLLSWLQTWPSLYVIINYVCSTYAKSRLVGTLLNLQFWPHLMQVNADAVALAGYLSLGIPLIAAGLMRGVANMIAQLTHQEVIQPQPFITMESAPTGLHANVQYVQSQLQENKPGNNS